MEENNTKIILAVIGLIVALIGGALISIKNKKRSNKVNQDNITIKGNKNKIVGGDDNSKN